MTPLTKSENPHRLPWTPAGGFVFLGAAGTAAAADEAKAEGETESEIVGTSTLKPGPTQVPQKDWKGLSVAAAVFFLVSTVMCVLIFKIYTKRNLV